MPLSLIAIALGFYSVVATSSDYDADSTLMRQYGVTQEDLADLDGADLREMSVPVHDRIALLRIKRRVALDATSSQQHVHNPGLPAEDFVFVVKHVNSSRQSTKCLNIIVKYRYPVGVNTSGYIDYKLLRSVVLEYAQPTPALPEMALWEDINKQLALKLMSKFKIDAVSTQIQVLNQVIGAIYEPGNHGSIVTFGDMAPLSEPWANAFAYDCTAQSGPVTFVV